MNPHAYQPFTTRHGWEECRQCHMPENHPVHHVGDASVLDRESACTGVVWYRVQCGMVKSVKWSTTAVETADSLRSRFSEWFPTAEYLGCAIKTATGEVTRGI